MCVESDQIRCEKEETWKFVHFGCISEKKGLNKKNSKNKTKRKNFGPFEHFRQQKLIV